MTRPSVLERLRNLRFLLRWLVASAGVAVVLLIADVFATNITSADGGRGPQRGAAASASTTTTTSVQSSDAPPSYLDVGAAMLDQIAGGKDVSTIAAACDAGGGRPLGAAPAGSWPALAARFDDGSAISLQHPPAWRVAASDTSHVVLTGDGVRVELQPLSMPGTPGEIAAAVAGVSGEPLSIGSATPVRTSTMKGCLLDLNGSDRSVGARLFVLASNDGGGVVVAADGTGVRVGAARAVAALVASVSVAAG